ncbi:CDGSH iron-sulfur domain-containing protein [Balneola sp. MJW-20]|uniref:CDGSH iron-sulfur domain-containing protein n=1 Tax=Gracilimonas aurantiaca TaxID=3234185 RepID=UPI00346651FA
METKTFSYESDNIKVTWDKKRCIHAEECVKGLPDVFNINQKPWIQPENAKADAIRNTIHKCPTGALQYEMLNSAQKETPPEINIVRLAEDGPVYIHGDIVIEDLDGNELMKDTRVAMCRCGLSSNKPFCDNSHIEGAFKADTSFNPERLQTEPVTGKGGELRIKLFPNAPFLVQGHYTLTGKDTDKEQSSKKMSFCRCGASSTKPFCDGSHKEIGFNSEA